MKKHLIQLSGITTWINVYKTTINNKKGYINRLNELTIWDKPLVEKNNDNAGKLREWEKKCIALNYLINN